MAIATKKTLWDKRQDYERDVEEKAVNTYKWAKACRCIRGDDGEIISFFVIGKTKSKEAKPSWTEEFDEKSESWPDVADKMLALGMSICYLPFYGHYIGLPGEQGARIATLINNAVTRIKTSRKHLLSAIYSGQGEKIVPYLGRKLQPALQLKDIKTVLVSLEALLLDVGVETTPSMDEAFLDSWIALAEKNGDTEDDEL